MVVRIMLIFMLLCGQLAVAAGPKAPATPRPQSGTDPSFRDFVATNAIPTPDLAQQLGIGWVRSDLPWPLLEPQNGQFQWAAADATISKIEGMGLGFLPMVGYTPAWAASIPNNSKSAPKNPQDWTNFVDQLVARYSAAPYNLRYFQIWNEPTPQAGFFAGPPQQYIDQVYLPAAQVIRRHHCFVVFGGWPISNPASQFEQILNYHNAWQWTDIVDVHYMSVAGFEQLSNDWVRTGKCRGVWQSEMGYTTDPSYVPRNYLEALYWMLENGWSDPGRYKFFWFTLSSGGSDANNCLLKGGALTTQGIRLKVLNSVMGAGPLSVLNGVATQPALRPIPSGEASTALGFRVGQNRAVVAVILVNDSSTQTVSVQVPLPGRPASVQVVSSAGQARPIQGQFGGGRLTVNIPRSDLQLDGTSLIGYLQIDGI